MAEHSLDTSLDTGVETTPEPSLRDTLEEAFTDEPSDEVRQTPGEQTADEGQRARDELGRFAPGKADKAPGSPQEPAQPATGTVTPIARTAQPGAAPTPADKAPQSWTPSAREAWTSVPPAARQEIYRRESEMQRVLQDGAGQRQFIDAFERIVAPYEMFIRAEQSNPLQAVDNLMRTAAELRVGTPGSKAALIAELVTNFAVDIPMLDTLLANRGQIAQVRQFNQQQQPQFRDPRVDQILAAQQAQAAQASAREDAGMREALDEFAKTHEFYKDVASLMADLVDVRTQNRQPLDMEKIYAQACSLHDGVSQVVAQRRQRAPQQQRQAVLRAKRAAVSVSGESTPTGGATIPEDDSIRSLLEAAMDHTR